MISLREKICTPEDVVAVGRDHAEVSIEENVRSSMEPSRSLVEHLATTHARVYGVTTGFGALATTVIPEEERLELQRSIIRSHAAGVGKPVPSEIVRSMMFLRARSLAAGFSGVRYDVVEMYVRALLEDLVPWVPEHGSLGASGDLAPLAHIALAMAGEGVFLGKGGEQRQAQEVLQEKGIAPLTVDLKEGLALINGTDGMTALMSFVIVDLENLLDFADAVAALSVEALLGTDSTYRECVVGLRPSKGQGKSAAIIRSMLDGSTIVASHRNSDHVVQDPYSLRCIPQIHGAARDVTAAARGFVERELASIVDNPVVFPEGGELANTGNFHGQGLAYAADMCAMVLADVAALAERRVNRMLDPVRSNGLPAFLTPHPGTNSGLMIAQYTAAACVSALRAGASPLSVHSLDTSAEQEDHVSMGWEAALRTYRSIASLQQVLAIEALCAAQAVRLRQPLAPGRGTGMLLQELTAAVPHMTKDRFLAPDIDRITEYIASGSWHALIPALQGDDQ
ncbi:MAG: histidine ammonia-lyase [Candidatus Dormibacteria bacterium]